MTRKNLQLETLLNVKDVADILSVGVRTVWRWTALDKIPRPIRLGRHTVRWTASALQDFIDARAADVQRQNGTSNTRPPANND